MAEKTSHILFTSHTSYFCCFITLVLHLYSLGNCFLQISLGYHALLIRNLFLGCFSLAFANLTEILCSFSRKNPIYYN